MFSIVILAVSLSLDALGVGIVYGLRKIRIPLNSKLIICFFSIAYSAAALAAGKSLSAILPSYISNLIGILILGLMGVWIILQALFRKDHEDTRGKGTQTGTKTVFELGIKSLGITIQVIKNPLKGDIDHSGIIDIRESLLLGLALSVDAIGVGIGSGLAGFHSMLIPFAVGVFQLIFLYIGSFFGGRFVMFDRLNEKFLSVLPGVLLLFLAFIRIY